MNLSVFFRSILNLIQIVDAKLFAERRIIIYKNSRPTQTKITSAFARTVAFVICLILIWLSLSTFGFFAVKKQMVLYDQIIRERNPVILLEEIKKLKAQVFQFATTKNRLIVKQNHYKADIDILKLDNGTYKEEILDIKNEFKTEKEKNKRLTIKLKTLGANVAQMQTKISQLKKVNEEIVVLEQQNKDITTYLATVSSELDKVAPFTSRGSDSLANLQNTVFDITQLQENQMTLLKELNSKLEHEIEDNKALFSKLSFIDFASLANNQRVNLPMGQGGEENQIDINDHQAGELAQEVAKLQDYVAQIKHFDAVKQCIPFTSPVEYYHITSGFGKRRDPITDRIAQHNGIDMGAWQNSPIAAPAYGKVLRAAVDPLFGKFIEIEHDCGIITRYGHLAALKVKKGQEIKFGQIIGKVGNTGRSTGTHLHYEVLVNKEPIDPLKLIKVGYYVHKN